LSVSLWAWAELLSKVGGRPVFAGTRSRAVLKASASKEFAPASFAAVFHNGIIVHRHCTVNGYYRTACDRIRREWETYQGGPMFAPKQDEPALF
jgi:hypothetical protein